jgi:glycosyltransferase involved in cell wall biosynthesis
VRSSRVELIHSIEHTVYRIAADLARLCNLPVVVGVHCRMERGFAQWAFGGRRGPQRMFFLSQGSRDVCRRAVEGVVPESRWSLLPNGMDVARHCPDADLGRAFRRQHELGDGLLVGAASWLRPGKQLEHLFQAAAGLKHQQATLVLGGGVAPGEEDYARRVLAEGQRLLGPRLRYLGCLDDLRGFYNALDVYINTSLEETCSISIIESLACGCPVVGYPSVSVAEQILPNGGEIVAQDDCQQLTAAVDKWLGDDARRTAARRGARLQAEERFDIRRLADQLWNEYLGVVAAARTAPQASGFMPAKNPEAIRAAI